MSAASVQPGSGGNDAASNIGEMWREAVEYFEKYTSIKISNSRQVRQVRKVGDVLKEIKGKHSKSDKLRKVVIKNWELMANLESLVELGADIALSPIKAIFTAAKFLIRTAKRVKADYDIIEELFGDIGAYMKRLDSYQDLELHPEHRNAQVQVLTSILMFSAVCTRYVKNGLFLNAVRTLFGRDKEVETAYKDLQRKIKYEIEAVPVTILSEMKVYEKRASQDRKMILENTEHLQRQFEDHRKTSEREEILKWLSPFDFNRKQRDTFDKCHPGTGRRLLQTDEFQKWFKGKDLSTLLCHGILGSGKTITTSVAVDYIHEDSESDEDTTAAATSLAFFYCNSEYQETQSECQLLSSVAKQLAEQTSSLPSEVAEFWRRWVGKKRNPTGDEWISLIRSLCQYFQTTYLLVDALDEFPQTNRGNLLRLLQGLVPCVRFLFTSRSHVGLPDGFTNVSRIEISATKADIEKYLESRINETEGFSVFLRKDPDLQGDIIRSITAEAAGMFLLAGLHIGSVLGQNNLQDVREALTALPQRIYEAYGDAMERIEAGQGKDPLLSKRALFHVAFARRPLNVTKLLHALSVNVSDTGFDKDAEVNVLLHASAGLLHFDEERDTIGLAHDTLQEYLDKNPGKLLPNPEAEIART